jgi:hypothetical protein
MAIQEPLSRRAEPDEHRRIAQDRPIPTIMEILSTEPDAFVAKYSDIAAINMACAAGLPNTDDLDIPKYLAALDAMALWVGQKTGPRHASV